MKDVSQPGAFQPGPDPRRNLEGCPPGAHHIGRPKDQIKAECYQLATEAAPLILARFIRISLGENTESVVNEAGECLQVPAPSPSQIKAGEAVLKYVLEEAAKRLELTGKDGDPLPDIPTAFAVELARIIRERSAGTSGSEAGGAA